MLRFFGIFFLLLGLAAGTEGLLAQDVNLDVNAFVHVTFKGLKPTIYSNDGPDLIAKAHASASFLLLPFTQIRIVKMVSFVWQGEALSAVKNPTHEATKDGDDAALRIGLILAGDPPLIPYFAPSWLKAVRGVLKLPSNKMIFLVAGARHNPGEIWRNPMSDSIEYVAVGDHSKADGWRTAEVPLQGSKELVGLWIMADGDNTESKFTTRLRNLRLD